MVSRGLPQAPPNESGGLRSWGPSGATSLERLFSLALATTDKPYQSISPSHRQTESALTNGTPAHWPPAPRGKTLGGEPARHTPTHTLSSPQTTLRGGSTCNTCPTNTRPRSLPLSPPCDIRIFVHSTVLHTHTHTQAQTLMHKYTHASSETSGTRT